MYCVRNVFNFSKYMFTCISYYSFLLLIFHQFEIFYETFTKNFNKYILCNYSILSDTKYEFIDQLIAYLYVLLDKKPYDSFDK